MAQLQGLCLVVTMVVYLGNKVVTSAKLNENKRFGILVDAGSSSSKVKLYEWTPQKSLSSMPKVTLVKSTKFGTPLTQFTHDPEGLGGYVDDILDWAAELIPQSQHSTTPILMQATAGMRFEDSATTYQLLQGVREILSNTSRSPFSPTLHNDVSVISGEEEAVYAWIAVNYLKGFFEGKKSVKDSVGILEMGGGSTQIAFIPEGPLYDEEFQVRLANRRYSLYAHSYLDFGANAMNKEIAHEIMSEMTTDPDQLQYPCMFKGHNMSISMGQNVTVELIGDGNASRCSDILKKVLKPAEGIECQPKPCAIRQIYQPKIGDATFYATQAFSYAPKTLNATRTDGTLDLEKMQESAKELCDLTLQEAKENHPERGKYISSDCLMGAYVPILFQHYGFSPDTEKIILSSKIESQKIDWALGAMLMKLSDKFASSHGTFSVLCPSRGGNNGTSSSNGRGDFIQLAVAIVVTLLFHRVNIRQL